MKTVQMDDIKRYAYPENLQYSPDGKVLAFQVATVNEDDYIRQVYCIENGKCSAISSVTNTTLVGFEDSETLIVRKTTKEDQPGITNLYQLPLHGGEAKEWITLPFGLGRLWKVDDSTYLATGAIQREDPDAYLDSKEVREKKLEAKNAEKDFQVVDEIPYWFNGSGFLNTKRTAIFRIDLKKEMSVKRITPADFDLDSIHVNGNQVFYSGIRWRRRKPDTNRLFRYEIRSGKTTTLYGKKEYAIEQIFFRDEKLYVLASDHQEYGLNETAKFYEVTDSGLELRATPERVLYNSVIGDTMLGGGYSSQLANSNFITLATQEDHTEIWSYDSSFQKTVIFRKPGVVHFLAAHKDQIAFAYSSSKALTEIFELKNGTVKRVSNLNTEVFKDTYVATPKKISYTSQDEHLHGWVLEPPNFSTKKTYPGILDIHGGPRCVYGENFMHEMQLWAGKGYLVFFTNIRGSDGRGDAFADIRDQYGEVDYQNLMDFTDAVEQAYPNLDRKKICETGGSYGGFMSNWIIGHTDRFCAVASQRSISNWISMAFLSDIGIPFSGDQCGAKNAFQDTEKFWKHSPLKYADRVKTPTLFIHSDEDYRCPLPEGMQMMQALAYRNVETRMCIFHGENHELSRSGKPSHRIRRLQEITDWFDAHTK